MLYKSRAERNESKTLKKILNYENRQVLLSYLITSVHLILETIELCKNKTMNI